MPTEKFNDKFIRGLKAEPEYVEYWDSAQKALGLRVSPKGRKSWMMRYRFQGQRRRLLLDATFPEMGLAAARKQAQLRLGQVAEGIDPAAERRNQRAGAADRSTTFGRLVSDFLEHSKGRKRASSLKEDSRQFEKDLLPAWRSRRIDEIGPRDVDRLLEGLVRRGAPVQANRTRALLSTLFNFAIRDPKWQGVIDSNPVRSTWKPTKEKPRKRKLSKEEVRRFWNALDSFSPVVAASYRLRLLTGQRDGEVRTMRWSEIEGDWWTIPDEKTKNKEEHRVFLSRAAHAILDELRPDEEAIQQMPDGCDWVVPSPRLEGRPLAKQNSHVNRRLHEAAALKDFRPHDLRRTAATFMAKECRVRHDVIKRVLNHKERDITTEVYNLYNYDDEIKDALSKWGERLEAIVSGDEIAKILPHRTA